MTKDDFLQGIVFLSERAFEQVAVFFNGLNANPTLKEAGFHHVILEGTTGKVYFLRHRDEKRFKEYRRMLTTKLISQVMEQYR